MGSRSTSLIAAGTIVVAGVVGFATFTEARGDRGAGGHGRQLGQYHGGGGHAGMRGRRGQRLERLLERFDANEDGKLTQAEVDASRRDLVAKHDANKDGALSLEEYQALWLEVMRRRMVRGFQHVDEDGDARVTVEEFLDPYAHIVERMDRDGDGAVSRDDRRRAMRDGRGPRGDDERPSGGRR